MYKKDTKQGHKTEEYMCIKLARARERERERVRGSSYIDLSFGCSCWGTWKVQYLEGDHIQEEADADADDDDDTVEENCC